MHIKIGTRSSKLALWQAEYIASLLNEGGMTTELVTFETKGDKILDVSLSKIGSKGLFTEELEQSLRSGEIDIAVHSAKDLQSSFPSDLEIISFTEREVVNDVLVSFDKNLRLSQADKVIGTSSTRRRALLKHVYPEIKLGEMRGNLQTRIQKMKDGHCDALLLAYAGVHRMGYDDMIVQKLDEKEFVPPVGQGSVAIQVCNEKMDGDVAAQIRALTNHAETESALLAERKYLEVLDGGCSVPVFAYAQTEGEVLNITGGVVSLDGKTKIEKSLTSTVDKAKDLGESLAKEIIDLGGADLLKEIKSQLKK